MAYSMSKLDDLVKSKLAAAAEEKSSKQSGRFRLVADATISVASIQEVLTRHVHLKQEKQIWALICPSAVRTFVLRLAQQTRTRVAHEGGIFTL